MTPNDPPAVLTIARDGTIRTIALEAIPWETLGTVTTRRASHVRPYSPLARLAWETLRHFGDTGPLAWLSRRLPGPWEITIAPHGPTLAPLYRTRAEAIQAEIAWINRNVL